MFSKLLDHENSILITLLVKTVDLLFYLLAAVLTFNLQFKSLHFDSRYALAIVVSLVAFNFVFTLLGVYKSLRGKSIFGYLQPLFAAMLVLILFLAAIAFITKTGERYSRGWFLAWHGTALVMLVGFRIVLRQLLNMMRKRGLNQKLIVIIGNDDTVAELIHKVQAALWSGFRIVAVFVDTPNVLNIAGFTTAQIPPQIDTYVIANGIAEVWINLPLTGRSRINELVRQLQHTTTTIRYFPNIAGVTLLHQSVTELFGVPVINIIASPMTGVDLLQKSIEDKLLASIFLLIISPLLLLIAALVKLSSHGPVFYRQERVGWNGEIFQMLKFRTMPVDAEVATGAIWATAGDKRATKIGAFLRKTSLDELPQFINVLCGEMSIVGPRPERQIFVDKFKTEIPSYMQKHLVKAGITGWAQVNGWRGNTSLEKRIECDLYYINHWSLWFDLKIIFFTIFKGFINKNAY